LQNLKEEYRDIRITYTVGDPVMVEKDGALTVIQTEESKVEMTDEQLKAITVISGNIRNKLISNN